MLELADRHALIDCRAAAGLSAAIDRAPTRPTVMKVLVVVASVAACGSAHAWGNEGHQVVATIAQHYLTPATLAAVNALLAQDTSTLTAHTLAAEATWADAYRASSAAAYAATHKWHFADIEVPGGTLQTACFGFPALPAGTPASAGPADDCHVDKIAENMAELKPDSDASPDERVLALKFLLHFVGDLHQPLHSADENDGGGNGKLVSATASGLGSGKLHGFWDTQFVASYGTQYPAVAAKLQRTISKSQFASWYRGDAKSWAVETNAAAAATAYGRLPAPGSGGVYALSPAYVSAAESVVGVQLAKAGVRLAYVLNQTFDPAGKVPHVPRSATGRPARHGTVPPAVFIADDEQHQPLEGDR